MSDEAILSRLVLAGWRSDVVSAGLQNAAPYVPRDSSVAPLVSAVTKTPTYRRRLSPAFSLGIGAVALIGSLGIYLLRPAPVVYSISLDKGDAATSTPLVYGSWPALSDEHFYEKVKQRFIDQHASFIAADLSSMSLTVYKDGAPALVVPILAKGKVGSWWETPAGLYDINTKEENHLSSFGKVYQPYSLAFEGNFFIHGWPYYPDGAPVSSTYSGGCIRLSTDDAKKVYDLAAVGMPVFVYNTPAQKDAFMYTSSLPNIDATAYVVADIKNGAVLGSQNATTQLPIASITKLMTALVTVEYLNLENTVVVPRESQVGTTVHRLVPGKEYTVHDLLILMLTESSNEAAETLAAAVGRDRFIELMNKKAAAINLTHTTYIDPAGLEVGNSSTAEDLFTLVKYIYDNRRFVFDITSGSLSKDAYGAVAFGKLQNFNKIAGVSNAFLGGKIGQTNAAKETYAGVFMLSTGTEDRPVGVIVLESTNVQSSIKTLLSYLNTFYGSGSLSAAR